MIIGQYQVLETLQQTPVNLDNLHAILSSSAILDFKTLGRREGRSEEANFSR